MRVVRLGILAVCVYIYIYLCKYINITHTHTDICIYIYTYCMNIFCTHSSRYTGISKGSTKKKPSGIEEAPPPPSPNTRSPAPTHSWEFSPSARAHHPGGLDFEVPLGGGAQHMVPFRAVPGREEERGREKGEPSIAVCLNGKACALNIKGRRIKSYPPSLGPLQGFGGTSLCFF